MKKNLVILAIFAISIVAIYSLNQAQPENIPVIDDESIPPIIDTNNTATDTSDWQTYRNEKYGFEIKYPDTFIIKEYFEIQRPAGGWCDVVMMTSKEYPTTEFGKRILENKIFSFQIHINPTQKCEVIQTTSRYSKPDKYLTTEYFTANGIEFTKKKYLTTLPDSLYRASTQTAYEYYIWELEIDSKKYIFSYYSDNSSKQDDEFENILSTFKILN